MSLGGAIFIVSSLIAAKASGLSYMDMGIETDSILKDIKVLLQTIILVFPPFIVVNHIYQLYFLHRSFQFVLREDLIMNLLNNLLIVAIPEEIFFRGYLQSTMQRIYGQKRIMKFLSYSNLMTSLLFAVGHFFLKPRFDRLAVFFPSLLFGFLREKRENIYPSIMFHLLSNWMMYLILWMYK